MQKKLKTKGWYIYAVNNNEENKKDELSPGKKLFLRSVGFEVIKAKDFETIYEKIWK